MRMCLCRVDAVARMWVVYVHDNRIHVHVSRRSTRIWAMLTMRSGRLALTMALAVMSGRLLSQVPPPVIDSGAFLSQHGTRVPPPVDTRRIHDLIASMTLKEKIGQMT